MFCHLVIAVLQDFNYIRTYVRIIMVRSVYCSKYKQNIGWKKTTGVLQIFFFLYLLMVFLYIYIFVIIHCTSVK